MSGKLDLETKHQALVRLEPYYKRNLDLYNGGAAVEQGGYLIRHPFETKAMFETRQKRVAFRNFAAPIVDVFASAVWGVRPERKLPAKLDPLTEDVDRLGASADNFFFQVTQEAAAAGAVAILVDSTRAPKDALIETEADAQRAGIRPYFVCVPALNVLDWAFGADGKLEWVVIREEVEVDPEPFTTRRVKRQYRLWRRDAWELWEKASESDAPTKTDTGRNPLGEVPLVMARFVPGDSPMTGISALDDVATLILRVYRRDSERDESLFNSAIPLFVARGVPEEDLAGFVKSNTNGIRLSSPESSVEYVEPAGTSFAAIREAIEDDERSIQEIALRQIRPDSSQVESAEAKRLDGRQLDSQLQRFARSMAEIERRCWELAAAWAGVKDAAVEVAYRDDFDEQQITGDLLRSFSEMRRNGDISRETLWQMLAKLRALPSEFDATEEAARLEQEARQAAGPVGGIHELLRNSLAPTPPADGQ